MINCHKIFATLTQRTNFLNFQQAQTNHQEKHQQPKDKQTNDINRQCTEKNMHGKLHIWKDVQPCSSTKACKSKQQDALYSPTVLANIQSRSIISSVDEGLGEQAS